MTNKQETMESNECCDNGNFEDGHKCLKQPPTNNMQDKIQWEYKVENLMSFERLNMLGSVGWELVCITDSNYYFKRPLTLTKK